MEIIKPSTKGQIVIPKGIRDKLKIDEDTQLGIIAVGDQIVMKKIDTEKIRKEVEEFWEMRRKAPKLTSEEIERVIREVREQRRAEGRSRY
jgi:antitoxin PrlF